GLEVNPYCHAWATDFVGVSSELALLNETEDQTFDLIVAIHVFEHLYDPRKLFKDMISRVNADGAI
ncbi:MAG: methyltransferase domain-containing protein, partial [Actinomycetota bacterium]